ncbi:hypothetical protein FRC14_007119 [Serendipita sp. 396]|nr:hypothetical protein FRC14_007119 [Serendipita sp. 396]
MATVAQPKRPRESDDEDIDANDQLVDPALVHADAAKRKRGRPASSSKKAEAGPSVEAANDATVADPAAPATGDPAPPPVKRGRGRPKKIKTAEEIAAEEAKKNRPPAKRGRPRKKPKVDEDASAVAAVDVAAPVV